MRTHIPGILRAVDGMAWAIVPEKLQAILDVLEMRAAGQGPRPGFVAAVPRKPAALARAAGGKIAVLPLYGMISMRANLMTEDSGGTSTELFGKQVDAAVADPNVGAIVLDVDSPGGAVDGVPELAAKLYGARGAKPIIAVCNTLNASAAYWISSAADSVIATPSAQIGSIGVFTVRIDTSRAAENAGVKYTVIKAGKYKAGDLPFEPMSEDERTLLQTRVDELYGMFAGSIAQHRGVSEASVRAGYGQGQVLSARAALAAKMIDRVATLDTVLLELGAPRGAALQRSQAERAVAASVQAGTILAASTYTITPTRDGRLIIASTPNHEDVTGPGPANDPARDPTGDPPSTTAPQADAGDQTDDYTPGDCTICGEDMDPNGVCPNCGWLDPDGPSAIDDGNDDAGDNNPDKHPALNDPTLTQGDASPDGALHLPHADARRVASDALAILSASPAPKATEHTTMPEQNGTATADPGAAHTQDRFAAIAALAEEHGYALADVSKWMKANASVEAVRGEILTGYKAGARPVSVRDMKDREADRKFLTLGEQLVAVVQASKPGGRMDRRLLAVNDRGSQFFAGTPSGMSEGVGTDGGFLIQPDLLTNIIEPIYKEDPILSRVTRIPIGSNTNGVKYPVVDEISRTTGNRWGGVQMYWASEADTATASKPKLRIMELNLKDLLGIAYMTEELQLDAPAAEALLTAAFTAETQFMLTAMIFSGTGGGQPQGIIKSGALITQGIEGTQTIANTATFIGLNLTKMLARVPSSLWGDVIFLYQQELLPYLMNATIGSSGTAVPVFVPLGGFVNRPFDMILGRPAFPSEFCEAVGTPGDIYCVVPSQYHVGEKGGAEQAWSMHVRFLNFENTLRIRQRIDGAPLWRTTVTPYKGANSRSPFVVLGTRS